MPRDADKDLAQLQRTKASLERKVERLEEEIERAHEAIGEVDAMIIEHDPTDDRYQGEPGDGGETIAQAVV